MSTTKVTIAMQKGGVGKSTTAMNLAGAFADRGDDTLLVDLDAQGHSTKALGFNDAYRADDSIADALTKGGSARNLIVNHDELDVLPSHVRLFNVERADMEETAFRDVLNTLESDYDAVVVDTPPSLDVITDAAILGTERVLFPAQAHRSSRDSIEIIFEQIDTLEDSKSNTHNCNQFRSIHLYWSTRNRYNTFIIFFWYV